MISVVAQKYNIHPQTLRLYEREGLLKPSRTDGNTRLYSEQDLEQLETILSLTRDLGVNLAGVEIILNMRRKIEAMQLEVNEFMEYVKRELSRGIGDWEQRLRTALVKSSPTDLVRTVQGAPTIKEADEDMTAERYGQLETLTGADRRGRLTHFSGTRGSPDHSTLLSHGDLRFRRQKILLLNSFISCSEMIDERFVDCCIVDRSLHWSSCL